MAERTVGYNLMLLRCEAHKSQKDVAEHIGVTVQMVSQYEQGVKKLPYSTAVRLCSFLGCSLDDFHKEVPHEHSDKS